MGFENGLGTGIDSHQQSADDTSRPTLTLAFLTHWEREGIPDPYLSQRHDALDRPITPKIGGEFTRQDRVDLGNQLTRAVNGDESAAQAAFQQLQSLSQAKRERLFRWPGPFLIGDDTRVDDTKGGVEVNWNKNTKVLEFATGPEDNRKVLVFDFRLNANKISRDTRVWDLVRAAENNPWNSDNQDPKKIDTLVVDAINGDGAATNTLLQTLANLKNQPVENRIPDFLTVQSWPDHNGAALMSAQNRTQYLAEVQKLAGPGRAELDVRWDWNADVVQFTDPKSRKTVLFDLRDGVGEVYRD